MTGFTAPSPRQRLEQVLAQNRQYLLQAHSLPHNQGMLQVPLLTHLWEQEYLHHIQYILSFFFLHFHHFFVINYLFLSLSSNGISIRSPMRRFFSPAATAFAYSIFLASPRSDMRYAAPVFPASSPNTILRLFPTTLGDIGSYAAGFFRIAARCVPALCLYADVPTIGFESYGLIDVYCSISFERSTNISSLKSFGDLYR